MEVTYETKVRLNLHNEENSRLFVIVPVGKEFKFGQRVKVIVQTVEEKKVKKWN